MKTFYVVSTHWDREWYKPFQGFRYDLIKVTDNIISALENGDIDIFTFDGQTVVLEDYLEIRPENRDKITRLIKDGKLKVGPWYVMPDELLVSGESLIKNFLTGKAESEKFGAKPWSYGYMNDIFGHIAQMPQIMNGFGIKSAYLGRGMGGDDQNYKNFVWKSPDGSECIGYKDVYARLWENLKNSENKREDLEKFIKENTDESGTVILMYTNDHTDINQDTYDFVNLAREMNISPAAEEAADMTDKSILPTAEGELVTPAQTKGSFRLVTDSLSSYYPLKYENDNCENLLENKISPMLAMAKMTNINLDLSFWNLAYRYLLKNQPHDSICGCSSDTVHKDMPYRYSQVKSICKALENDFENNVASHGENYYFSIMNYDIHKYEGVIITELRINKDCALNTNSNTYYQEYLTFDIKDENGNRIPYEILNIEKNRRDEEKAYVPGTDRYRIAMYAKLNAFGKTTFSLSAQKPEISPYPLSDGGLTAENKYLKVEITPDGSINLTDKENGRKYENLCTYTDDGEIGNGWFSERPVSRNSRISSVGAKAKIETLIKSELITTFRITKYMNIPKCADYTHMARSTDDTEMKIVSDISLKKDSKSVEFETTVYNTAKDHRLRMEIPTGIQGEDYYASQAFTFINRKRGISHAGLNSSEPELLEKNTSGIICVKDNKGGLTFAGKAGFHHCGVSEDGVISVIMLRSFGRFMGSGMPAENAQLQGKHIFRYAITTETDFPKLCNMKKIMLEDYTNIVSDRFCSSELISAEGNVAVSTVKPAENKEGIIIRLYNPCDSEENCTLRFTIPIKKISEVNLAEEYVNDVETVQDTVRLNLKPHKVRTIYIKV